MQWTPLLTALLYALIVPGQPSPVTDQARQRLTRYIEHLNRQFPDVARITPAELAALVPLPVLLDVRSEKEFAVSHLPAAILVSGDPVREVKQMELPANTPIVVYCSVGYRSSVAAQKLSKAGFTNVRNLEGSIFAWAHENRPMVNASGPTSGVHPFNVIWGRYLDRSLWQWKPESK
ncbi:MAG: rhodanese-like domain-containing protein [Candidatus Methylacidiphilales bacterium]